VLLVLTGVLTVRSGWFGFFIVVAFGYSRELLRWPWPMAVGAGAAVIGAISQTEGNHSPLPIHLMIFLVALLIDLALFPAFMWLIHDREQQVVEHRKSLTELSAVNRRLEATIAENEVLHRQLLAQARAAGVRDERRRMAREIHDTLAQGLTGIVTQLQAAEQAASHNPDGAASRSPDGAAGWRHHVDAATRLARESLDEARRSVDALRPEPLEGGRLSEAVAGVAERWSAMNGIPAQVTTTGAARPVQPEAEFALLRAAQEALANVARHARASRVGLTISYMENEVALDVRDDGVGFDPAVPDRGFGLVAMRQRIAALSGTLQVESEPGGGTAISACVPTAPALASS
jgi:signal transduction histidine kinase